MIKNISRNFCKFWSFGNVSWLTKTSNAALIFLFFFFFWKKVKKRPSGHLFVFLNQKRLWPLKRKYPFKMEGSKNIIYNGNSTDLFFTVCCYVLLPGTEKNAPWWESDEKMSLSGIPPSILGAYLKRQYT